MRRPSPTRAAALAVVKVIALHTVRTRVGCSLGANRNATRINRMARAARCAGVTCTRHLQGAEIERFRRADWLHRSQRGARPVHAGPVAVGRADTLRVAITEVMAAHDAKSLWGTLTPHQKARRGPWPRGRMVAMRRIGSVVDLELEARGDLGATVSFADALSRMTSEGLPLALDARGLVAPGLTQANHALARRRLQALKVPTSTP